MEVWPPRPYASNPHMAAGPCWWYRGSEGGAGRPAVLSRNHPPVRIAAVQAQSVPVVRSRKVKNRMKAPRSPAPQPRRR